MDGAVITAIRSKAPLTECSSLTAGRPSSAAQTLARTFGATDTVLAKPGEDVAKALKKLTGGGPDYAFECVGAGALADLIASSLNLDLPKRQEILETLDGVERLNLMSRLLANELQVLELQSQIHNQVQEEVDKNQREYYLREQMRVIQHELGEMDAQTREIHELREKIAAAEMPDEARAKVKEYMDRGATCPILYPMSDPTLMIDTFAPQAARELHAVPERHNSRHAPVRANPYRSSRV